MKINRRTYLTRFNTTLVLPGNSRIRCSSMVDAMNRLNPDSSNAGK